MANTAKSREQTRADKMHDIEGRHLGRCLDQLWGAGRKHLIELMDFPKADCQVMVVKEYESRVPTSGSGKPWPDLVGVRVYVPIPDESNTWDSLDEAFEVYARTAQENKKDVKAGVA